MVSRLSTGILGIVLGISAVTVSAQATQPQDEHPATPAARSAPAHSMEQMHKMMADPAKRQQMMERMAHCRDMMSMMMEHMKHDRMTNDQPVPHK